MVITQAAGIAASSAAVCLYPSYVRRSRPQRASWLSWAPQYALVALAVFLAAPRAWWLWLLPAAELACAAVVCVVSWRRPGQREGIVEWTILAGCTAAMIAWWLTRSASWAVLLLAAVEIAATIPTLGAVRRDPAGEWRPFWWAGAAAGAIDFGATPPGLLDAYPAGLMISCGMVLAAGRKAP